MDDDELARLEARLLETLSNITQEQDAAAALTRRIVAEYRRRRALPPGGTVRELRPRDGDERRD
jgi:hypothetical protein